MQLRDIHRERLERFRRSMNLIGPGPVAFHFRDCDAALEPLEPSGHWADLGSGAGFPGLVFADLFPEVQVDLVDSRLKRCVFLEQVVAEAGASHVSVRQTRIEALPGGLYDGVMARGLARPSDVVKLARPLLKPGGRILLLIQQTQPLPPDMAVIWENPYVIDGKKRRSVLLGEQGGDDVDGRGGDAGEA